MKVGLQSLLGVALLAGSISLGVATMGLSQPVPETKGVATAQDLSSAFRNVARSALPGVVSVISRTKAVQLEQPVQGNPLEDELFRRFFGEEFEGLGGSQRFRQRSIPPRQGQGSGFVIDDSGIIMTNSHVVSGASEVYIQFQDGTEVRADSWHEDPWSDVAIVRITTDRDLTEIPMGNDDNVAIGDWVLAMGDPFGVGTSVTAGIISGTGRAPHINEREDFLQTDAAINPGNSGGPLVNLRGEVIGINTAISTRSGGYDGVGFAVPINLARWVGQQLIDKGKVSRPYLGVAVQPLTSDLSRQFGIGLGEGALVAQTFPSSPAKKAGLQSGDVILDINGQQVSSGVDLQGIVERLEIGKTYPVQILRDGERTSINVTLEEMPKQFAKAAPEAETPAPEEPQTAAAKSLGLEVSDLTPEIRKGLSLEEDVEGVVVTSVESGGPAAEKGISQGVIIQRVGTTPVKSAEEFNRAVEKASGENGILLLVRSGEATRFVVVEPTE
jgi:serine protease Do